MDVLEKYCMIQKHGDTKLWPRRDRNQDRSEYYTHKLMAIILEKMQLHLLLIFVSHV